MNGPEPRNIALAGFMGTGKTTVGRLVAGQLGFAFVDTDVEVEARAGRRIAEIFAQSGEAAFRQIEAEVCLEAARQRERVIATGGGALQDERVYDAFVTGSLLVCLTCDLDEIVRRVGEDPSRPLFSQERERLARLLAGRAALYDSLPYQLDTTHRDPVQIAEEVLCLWQQSI